MSSFDCLHDMGDPAGAAAHIRQSLKPDGTWMVVEPMAGDTLQQNINPVSRLYYAASTMICVPTSRSQEVGTALGAQAGEARLREIMLHLQLLLYAAYRTTSVSSQHRSEANTDQKFGGTGQ